MPRGNDSAAALVDLRGEYGQYGGNAEDMIDANRMAMTPELRAALLCTKDQEASEALDLDEVQKAADTVDTVADAAVRGDWVVWVARTENGRSYKGAFAHSEIGGPKARGAAAVKAVEESDADRAVREAHEQRLRDAAESAKAAREAEAAAAEAQRKAAQGRQKAADDKK